MDVHAPVSHAAQSPCWTDTVTARWNSVQGRLGGLGPPVLDRVAWPDGPTPWHVHSDLARRACRLGPTGNCRCQALGDPTPPPSGEDWVGDGGCFFHAVARVQTGAPSPSNWQPHPPPSPIYSEQFPAPRPPAPFEHQRTRPCDQGLIRRRPACGGRQGSALHNLVHVSGRC
jgi:hypothetical protein